MNENTANPFRPGCIIDDPKLFAGREILLRRAYRDLCNSRNVFLIGERGVGKSSFGRQLMSLIEGDQRTFERFAIQRRSENASNITVNYRCQGRESISEIVAELIYALRSTVQPIGQSAASTVQKTTRTFKMDLKLLSAELKKEATTTESSQAVTQFCAEFTRSLNLYPELRTMLICFKIDELDLVINKIELAPLLKILFDNLADLHINNVAFILIGIADVVCRFQQQHPSITRYFSAYHLERMTRAECKEIIIRALAGNTVTFSEDVKNVIVDLASGFPDPVHQFGYEVFESARASNREGCISDVEEAILQVTQNSRAEEFISLLDSCPSVKGERILATMALLLNEDIRVEQISQETGININQCRKICNEQLTPRFLQQKRRGLYRFSDPLFREFLKLTSFQSEWTEKKREIRLSFLDATRKVKNDLQYTGSATRMDLSLRERKELETAFMKAILNNYRATGKASW
jgi:conflict system STAND superfamily ATPase